MYKTVIKDFLAQQFEFFSLQARRAKASLIGWIFFLSPFPSRSKTALAHPALVGKEAKRKINDVEIKRGYGRASLS